MEPSLNVRFEMTKEDLIEFSLWHQSQSRSIVSRRRRIVVVFGGLGILLGVFKLLKPELPDYVWVGSGALLLLAPILPIRIRQASRTLLQKMMDEGANRGLVGRREVSITPLELANVGDLTSVTIRWPAIERIAVTDGALYCYWNAAGAVIIPRRAFASPAEFDAFVEAARRYQTDAAGRAK